MFSQWLAPTPFGTTGAMLISENQVLPGHKVGKKCGKHEDLLPRVSITRRMNMTVAALVSSFISKVNGLIRSSRTD
jgi:hypothetical protein